MLESSASLFDDDEQQDSVIIHSTTGNNNQLTSDGNRNFNTVSPLRMKNQSSTSPYKQSFQGHQGRQESLNNENGSGYDRDYYIYNSGKKKVRPEDFRSSHFNDPSSPG